MSEFKLAIPKKYSKKELIKMIMNASSQVGGGLAENTNTTRIEKNVVILGGGPVGLMTAILMKQVLPNLNYTIIEKYPEFEREQILVIDKNSYNLIPSNAKQHIWGQRKLGCYVHSPSKDLLGRCYTDQYSLPFASVSINVLQEALALSAQALGIQIIKPSKQQGKIIIDISPQHVSYRFLTDDTKTDLPYDFLIGADGVNSLIREKILQAKYPVDPNYKAYAGVFILYFKKGLPKVYSESPLPERGAKQNRVRWFLTQYRAAYIGLSLTEQEFYETKNRFIKNREDLPDKLRYILDTYIDFFGYHPDDLDLIKANTFEISLNKATKNIEWINNKMVAIVGDASFNIHFFSGSGLNLGIRSAVSLVENFEIWMNGLQDNKQFIKEYENDVSTNANIAREKSFESTLDVSTLTKKCNRYTLSNLQQLAQSKQLDPKNLSKEELCFLFLDEVPLDVSDISKLQEWLASYGKKYTPDQLTNLTALELVRSGITEIPPEISQLKNLRGLNLSKNKITEIPPELGQLTNLQGLNLTNNKISEIPPEIGQLSNLIELELWNNQISEIPPEIGQLTNLRVLHLDRNKIMRIAPVVAHLFNLTHLFLGENQITEIPQEIAHLTNLQILYLNRNQISEIPPEIGQLTNLRELWLGNNRIRKIPPEIAHLPNLQVLYIDNNQIKKIPSELNIRGVEIFI